MERENRIAKVWGVRDRVHLSKQCEIDLLTLLPNSQCSVHLHNKKFNKFIVVQGVVTIRTAFGDIKLKQGERIVVEPPLIHQFKTNNNMAVVLEIAYVDKEWIDSDDIVRLVQGGRTIKGKEYTLKEMKKTNLLKMLKKAKRRSK